MNKNKNRFRKAEIFRIEILMLLLAFVMLSCSEDTTPSLWEDKPEGLTPIINSVEPADKGLAGVSTVTITGENFFDNAEQNFVYFNSAAAEILESSTTKLVVKAPNLISDDVKLKIAVHGAELFSNDYNYKLEAAVSEFYPFKDFEQPYALTTDADGNIYMSFVSEKVGRGIKKLTTDGTIVDFAPKGGETFYNGIKYGADGAIYGVRNVRAVFKVEEGKAPAVFKSVENGISLLDLDFDKDLNIWTGGVGGKIFSIKPDKSHKAFDFEPSVNSIRVFNDYLYVAGATETEEAVWRFKIVSADELGPAEKYFDFSTYYPYGLTSIKAITFDENGQLFIGTDGEQTMIVVSPDGSHTEWYSGLLTSPVFSFAWGKENVLYYSREIKIGINQTIIRIDMERKGAPYYGRD